MKRFSFKVFVGVAFLHIAGTTWLVSATISHMDAYNRAETIPWFTALSWIWMPVPILLSHHLQFGPASYFYYLAFPWSVLVAVCCGFIVPYVARWRHRIA